MDYSRQELVSGIGRDGQKSISSKKVVLVGVGGIGCVSAQLIARAGIRELVVIDRDVVEVSNLQRQLMFCEADIGRPKAEVAAAFLRKSNPDVCISYFSEDLDLDNVHLLNGDLVLDCTDNMEVRYLINDYCMKKSIPWVYSAAAGNSVSVFSIRPGGPCFRCVFPDSRSGGTCEVVGITAHAVTVAASLQVCEAFKLMLKSPTVGMIRFDLSGYVFSMIQVSKRGDCRTCDGKLDYLEGRTGSTAIKLCGRGMYQLKGLKVDIDDFRNRVIRGGCVSIDDVIVFPDGRALVRAASEAEARSKCARIFG
ncbi:ThiF family adenylyltransferase [Candidatus Woesearchaeota archaeon]|nr:ThiF family adenylyltransferase [Candidatus Woesearchaeota archaeon]